MMWWTKAAQKKLDIPLPDYAYNIIDDITKAGGRALIVGGAIRDAFLGKKSKDIDFEIYRVSYEDLLNILQKYGKAGVVGNSFGVIKFVGPDGSDFDFSLPRIDSKTGEGHKDFNVKVDSNLTPFEAARRRDFTVNAISYDPITGEIIDPHNGKKDLDNKVLRHVSELFSDDPLRALRGMQFYSRLGFDMAPETVEMLNSIKDKYKHLDKARMEEEFSKLIQKGINPGRALEYLYNTGWSENFPEIHEIKGVPQESEWHPEGGVDIHTAHVMNEAARIADEKNLSPEDREVLIYAALAHDFAKPQTTKVINKKGVDRITSHGHEEQGVPLAESFLKSIGVSQKVIDRVKPLVGYHLAHIHFQNAGSTDAFIKQLAENIHPSNIEMLTHLMEADHSGRPPLPKQLPEQAAALYNRAKELGLHQNKATDLLQGKDILAYGVKPGPYFGEILKEARKLLLADKPQMANREMALVWLDEQMKKRTALLNGNDIKQYTNLAGHEIKVAIDQAWDAQKAHLFEDKASGIQWLINTYGS